MFLLTCSPEVHSAEHLWLLTHEALAKVHFETLGDLDGALAQRCRILANDPDQKAVHHLHRDGQGFIYLAAILNWNSRAVLTPRAMPPVLARHPPPPFAPIALLLRLPVLDWRNLFMKAHNTNGIKH
jgi:hypothetical protein